MCNLILLCLKWVVISLCSWGFRLCSFLGMCMDRLRNCLLMECNFMLMVVWIWRLLFLVLGGCVRELVYLVML